MVVRGILDVGNLVSPRKPLHLRLDPAGEGVVRGVPLRNLIWRHEAPVASCRASLVVLQAAASLDAPSTNELLPALLSPFLLILYLPGGRRRHPLGVQGDGH